MDITLDITNKFNTLVNYDYFLDNAPMNPIIFLEFPNNIVGGYEFELMNFGLNISSEMKERFGNSLPNFKDIFECSYQYQRIIIYGKAKFKITGLKGGDVKFTDIDNPLNGKKFYYTWPYKVEKGDFDFICGGNSSFSPHFTTVHLIGSRNARATITFSSEDYILICDDQIDTEDIAASKQTPYNYVQAQTLRLPVDCNNVAGKMFNLDFRDKYFDLVYREHFHTTIATNSEE